jgi:hypothetical protein
MQVEQIALILSAAENSSDSAISANLQANDETSSMGVLFALGWLRYLLTAACVMFILRAISL